MKLDIFINVMSPEVTKNYLYFDIVHPVPAGAKRCIGNTLIPVRPFLGITQVDKSDHNINKGILRAVFEGSLDSSDSENYALLVIHPLVVNPDSCLAYSATTVQVIESVLESHPKIDENSISVTYVAPGMPEDTMSYSEFCITRMS